MLNTTRLLAMARKEAIQLRRDSRSMILAFLLPVILVVLFGYAITWDVNDVPTAVVDQDNSARSRELIDAFRSSGYFTIVTRPDRPANVDALIDRGDIWLALVIPPDFAERLDSGQGATVQAILDGSDANTATIVGNYTRAVAQSYSAEVQLEGQSFRPPVTLESRVWYNEELTSRNMIVPGLVAVIMMIIAPAWGRRTSWRRRSSTSRPSASSTTR